MMPSRDHTSIDNASPSVTAPMTSRAKSAVPLCALPEDEANSSNIPEQKESSSSFEDPAGAGTDYRVSSAEAMEILLTAIGKYVRRRIRVPSPSDGTGVSQMSSIANGDSQKRSSCSSFNGKPNTTPQPSDGDKGGDVDEESLITSTQQVESDLLRCLLHVELAPDGLPSQPEILNDCLGVPSAITPEKAALESLGVHFVVPRAGATTSSPPGKTAGGESRESPPHQRASVRQVAENDCTIESTVHRSRVQSSSSITTGVPAVASVSTHAPFSSGNTRAKELYYTYTRRGVPPPRSRQRARAAAVTASLEESHVARHPRHSANCHDTDEKGSASHVTASTSPQVYTSGGSFPEYNENVSAFPPPRRGVVRPLHKAEMRAAMRSWPSRIAQYVFAATLTEQELRRAVKSNDNATNAKPPRKSESTSNGAPPSSVHVDGMMFGNTVFQVGDVVAESEDGGDVALDAILRRLCDFLNHTSLGTATRDTGAGQPRSIAFPSFARFYLADGPTEGIVGASKTDERATCHSAREEGCVHACLVRLAEVLLSSLDAGATGLAPQENVSSAGKGLMLSGDIVTTVEALLKHTPLMAVPKSPSALSGDAPTLTSVDVGAATPPMTARSAVWQALRSLLHLSPSSRYNPTVSTTPLVVGLVRRYIPGRTSRSNDDHNIDGRHGSGEDLQVRLLPVSDLFVRTDGEETTMAAPGPGGELGGCQCSSSDLLRTPPFFMAVFLEVSGEDVLYLKAGHPDAVSLEEENSAKVRYEADVPHAYRERHSRHMSCQNRRGVHHREGATLRGDGLGQDRSAFIDNTDTLVSTLNSAEGAASLSTLDRCLSRHECAFWEKLLAIAHFVQVSGTPAEVETTARYVTLATRRRREAREQSERRSQHGDSSGGAVTSVAQSLISPSVPAFFFTLTETSELVSSDAAAAVDLRRALFCSTKDDVDDCDNDRESVDYDATAVDAAQGARTKSGSVLSVCIDGRPPRCLLGGSGLSLRGFLGWGKAAPSESQDQFASSDIQVQGDERGDLLGAPPPRHEKESYVHATQDEPMSATSDIKSTEENIMDWMHEVLIPLFYETTVSGSFASHQGSAAPATSLKEKSGDDSEVELSAAAATAPRKRVSYHLRSQRVLLGRVQAVTPSMVYGGRMTAAGTATSSGAACSEASTMTDTVVQYSSFDAHLLSYLLLHQLFFNPRMSSTGAVNLQRKRACSAPLPQRALYHHYHPVVTEDEQTQQASSQLSGVHSMRGSPRRVTGIGSPQSPNAQVRHVGFREAMSSATPLQRSSSFPVNVSSSGTPRRQRSSSTTTMEASAEQPTPISGSPRSILKSGRRYRREKLIRNSAPAASIAPFTSLWLWRLWAAEVLGCGNDGGDSRLPQRQKNIGDISSISRTLCITSASYLRYTQALAVRVASDVAITVMLSGLLAELYASSTEVRACEPCNEAESPIVANGYRDALCTDAAEVDKERMTKEEPLGLNIESMRCRALSCDDLLPLAIDAALGFVRAALAPLLCNLDADPAHQGRAVSRLTVDIDVRYLCDEEECRTQWRDVAQGEEMRTGDSKSKCDQPQNDAPPHPRHDTASPVGSCLCPRLSLAALHRLQTLSLVSLLHTRQQVLDSVTRPLDVLLRHMSWALATHRLRALCQPLNDFLGRGSLLAALRGSDSDVRRVQAEHELWRHVHEVLAQYEGCLVLPHLLPNGGASMLEAALPDLAGKNRAGVEEAAARECNGAERTPAHAHDEQVGLASFGQKMSGYPQTYSQESVTNLSIAAVAPAATEGGSGSSPIQWLAGQQQTLGGSSAQRSVFDFVPLSFANAGAGPTHSHSLSTAQYTVLQPRSPRSSPTCVPRSWSSNCFDAEDSQRLYSCLFDGRGTRLGSTAAHGEDRAGGVGGTASDLRHVATSVLRETPVPMLAVGTRTNMKRRPVAVSDVFGEGISVDNVNSAAALGSSVHFLGPNDVADVAHVLPCESSRSASCAIEAAPSVPLFQPIATILDVPVPTVSEAARGCCQSGSPPILVDANKTSAPFAATSETCSAPIRANCSSRSTSSPKCAALQCRLQHAQVSSHMSSVLTLTSAVSVGRRLQPQVPSAWVMDGEHARVAELSPLKSIELEQQEQQPESAQTSLGKNLPGSVDDSSVTQTGWSEKATAASAIFTEEDAGVDVSMSKASVMPAVVQARKGAVVEGPLLSPYVREAKHVVVAAMLRHCFLPLWTQLLLTRKQKLAGEDARGEKNNADTSDMSSIRHETAPRSLSQLDVRGGYSLSPAKIKAALSTAPASSCGHTRNAAGRNRAVLSPKAEALLARHVEKLTDQNVELRRRLHDSQRLLADLHQTCCGLREATRQYERALTIQREDSGMSVVAVTSTHLTDTSVSLPEGGSTLPARHHPGSATPSPLSSMPLMTPGVGLFDFGERQGDPAAEHVMGRRGAALCPLDTVDFASSLPAQSPPDLHYFERAEEGCQRVLGLCQRMAELLSGIKNPGDNQGEAAAGLLASAVAYTRDSSSQDCCATSPLINSNFYPIHFLSQGILGARCPSPPEPTSAELGAPAMIRGEYSGVRRHSSVSHGPSQLFAPLEPQPLRRNSAALTLVSIAPTGAMTMSSTILGETPGSTQTSTPIALLFVGAASSSSRRGSPVPLESRSVVHHHISQRPPLFLAQSSSTSVTPPCPVGSSVCNTDVNAPRSLGAVYSVAASPGSQHILTPLVWVSHPAALSFDVRGEDQEEEQEEAPEVAVAPSPFHHCIPSTEKPLAAMIKISESHSIAVDSENQSRVPLSCVSSLHPLPGGTLPLREERSVSDQGTPAHTTVVVLSAHPQHAAPQPSTRPEDDLEAGAHTPNDGKCRHRNDLSSTLSSSSSGPSHCSERELYNVVKSHEIAGWPSVPQPSSLLSSPSTATTETSGKLPFMGVDGFRKNSFVATPTTVYTGAPDTAPIRDDDLGLRGIEVAEDTSHEHRVDDFPAQEVSHLQSFCRDTSFPLPRTLVGSPPQQLQGKESTSTTSYQSRGSPSFSNTLPRRVSVGTQLLFTKVSTSTQTPWRIGSDFPAHGVPPAIVVNAQTAQRSDNADNAGHGLSSSFDPCRLVNNTANLSLLPDLMPITGAKALHTRWSLFPAQEGAGDVSPVPASATTSEQATLNVATATAVSSPSLRERTPARSSEAAVTALAELQQRLSTSSGAVVELQQQLQLVREQLREKEADIIRLTEERTATEAARETWQRAAPFEEEEEEARYQQQQQDDRVCVPSPPPPRLSVATSTEPVLLSPSPFSTPLCEGLEKKGDSDVVADISLTDPKYISRQTEHTALRVKAVGVMPQPAAASVPSVPLETGLMSTGSPPALPSRVQLLRRVSELEDELRNANFRMHQWRALLEAKRHTHLVQVDQLTRRLESESRRCTRVSRSRSRSPLDSATDSILSVEDMLEREGEPRPLPPPPPLHACLPPPVMVAQAPSPASGDIALSPALRAEMHESQLRRCIHALTEQLHRAEALAARERARRVEAEDCINSLLLNEGLLRERLGAQKRARQEALAQQRQHEQDAEQRERLFCQEVDSRKTTLATMQAALLASSNELQGNLLAELDAERRAREAEAAAHRAAQERLARECDEMQRRLSCERDDAIRKQEELLVRTAAEVQAARSQLTTMQERIDRMTNELRTNEAESRERVIALEADLLNARATWQQWQQDSEERLRTLRHEYEECAEGARAAAEALRVENSELLQRYNQKLGILQSANVVSDEAYQAALEEVTRNFIDARNAHQRATEELCREQENHGRTALALEEARAENEALRRRVDIVSEQLSRSDIAASAQRLQETRLSTLEKELEEARTRQQESLLQGRSDMRRCEDALRREVETHVRTITALQEDRRVGEALQLRLKEELRSERLARGTEKENLEAVLATLRSQLSHAEQRGLDNSEALRHEKSLYERTLHTMRAAEEANRQLQRSSSALEARVVHCMQRWWSARETCAVQWMETKAVLLMDAFGIQRTELHSRLHEQQVHQSEEPPLPNPSLMCPSSAAATRFPAQSEVRREGRRRNRTTRHGQSLLPDAVASAPTASPGREMSQEMVVVSLDDPLGLRYELRCKARHITTLSERVRQLEEARRVDQQVVSTLQQLVESEDFRQVSSVAAPSRLPAHLTSRTLPTTLWPSSSPPRTASQQWSALNLAAAESSVATPTSYQQRVSTDSVASSPGIRGRQRLTPEEYRQRYALL